MLKSSHMILSFLDAYCYASATKGIIPNAINFRIIPEKRILGIPIERWNNTVFGSELFTLDYWHKSLHEYASTDEMKNFVVSWEEIGTLESK